MLSADPSALRWRKSSFSESGNCVEVAILDESVLIRDSKYGNDGILSVSSSAWRVFIQAIQHGSITLPDQDSTEPFGLLRAPWF
jgi:Domain of unknown function (DUF397)